MKKVVTRFSPSPTGLLHIGGVRTALYNYLFAKQNGGTFYLRIEDTDQLRFVEGAEDYIRRTLEWFGIEPDVSPWKPSDDIKGPYRQTERDYSKHIAHLLDNGFAYYAFDTKEDLDAVRETTPNFSYGFDTRMSMKNSLSLSKDVVDQLLKDKVPFVIRFKVPANTTVVIDDIIRGAVSFDTKQIDDKVLVKSNGIPTYHMANICDDHDMGTTHVIRGEEWLPSAGLHKLIYDAFGWDAPEFAHLPLILNPDGKGKLSKRKAYSLGIPCFPFAGQGEDEKGKVVDFKGFKDEGYLPDAVLNFLLMLGWSPVDNNEVLSLDDMIQQFSLDRVHKAGARFDIAKAKWFNHQYIQKKSDDFLTKYLDDVLKSKGLDFDYDYVTKVITLIKDRVELLPDLFGTSSYFFVDPTTYDNKVKKNWNPKLMSDVVDFLGTQDFDGIEVKIKFWIASNDLSMGQVFVPLRILLVGNNSGPDLFSLLETLGKDTVLRRLKVGINNLENVTV